MEGDTVASREGPWCDPNWESGLIQRLRRYWDVPVRDVPDVALATFLRQRVGLDVVIPEARRRVDGGIVDDTELYEGELAEALRTAVPRNAP